MKLIEPIRNLKLKKGTGDVTQWFGENATLYNRWGLAGHNGIDIVRPHGETMFAIESGTIISVKDEPDGFGRVVRLLGDSKDKDGYQTEWTYAHNAKNLVEIGDSVEAGQAIALMGNSGFTISGSTPFWKRNPYAGTHLHLGKRKQKVVRRGGWGYKGSDIRMETKDYENGYKGAIDPYQDLSNVESIPDKTAWKQLALTAVSLLNTIINIRK